MISMITEVFLSNFLYARTLLYWRKLYLVDVPFRVVAEVNELLTSYIFEKVIGNHMIARFF